MRKLKYLLFFMSLLAVLQSWGQQTFKYEYWIDNEVEKKVAATTDGEVSLSIDVSKLETGLHSFTIRAQDSDGSWSAPFAMYFFHANRFAEQNHIVCYEYWIDKVENKRRVDISSQPDVNFSLDMNQLPQGIHSFFFRAKDADGRWSVPTASYFVNAHTKDNNNRVVGYEYWFNDATEDAKYVETDTGNPLTLDQVELPVSHLEQHQDFGYYFRVDEKGVARLYLRNNKVTLRFKDANGVWSSPLVDYFSDQEGSPIEAVEIRRDTTVYTSDMVYDYYKYEAEKGDRIDVVADNSCSIEIYDPFGNRINKTDDYGSMTNTTISCQKSGMYYFVISNVDGWTTVNYRISTSYALYGVNTDRVGSSSSFQLIVSGNGFQSGMNLYLKGTEKNLLPESIDVSSRTEASAFFKLEDEPCGLYDLVAVFGEDTTIVLNECIEVLKDNTGEIPLIVSINTLGHSAFLRGQKVLSYVNVENPRLTTSGKVHVSVSFDVDDFADISQLKFLGDHADILEYIEPDMFDQDPEICQWIKDWFEEDGLRDFIAYKDEDGEKHIQCDLLLPEMAPNSTLQIPITMVAEVNGGVDPRIRADLDEVKDNKSESGKTEKCCEQMICYFNIIAAALGVDIFIDPACAMSLARDMGWDFARKMGCSSLEDNQPSSNGAWGDEAEKKPVRLNRAMVVSFLKCCFKSKLADLPHDLAKDFIKMLLKASTGFMGNIVDAGYETVRCAASNSLLGNCGEDQGDAASSFLILRSFDPNAKYGYLSPAGSTFFNGDVKEMNYVIEFENDPEKATAAAHDVYVTDTLDAAVFDLGSFRPLSLMAGDKFQEVSFNTQHHVWDIDMRPRMELITRVTLDYDKDKGVAKWHFASIDPSTDLPTENVYGGFLPPNDEDGNGTGSVAFSIRLKDGLDEGTKINNDAEIIFDYNDPIFTPIWSNVKDITPPISSMFRHDVKNDSIITLRWEGSDEASGVWKYNLYVQQGNGAPWFQIAKDITGEGFDYRVYDNIYYSFCCIATDCAGNEEDKTFAAEDSYYRSGNNVYEVSHGSTYFDPEGNTLNIIHATGFSYDITDVSGRLLDRGYIDSNKHSISLGRGINIVRILNSDRVIAKAKIIVK